jgi:molybdenum cofactor biosynthesis enzyme MoaA
MRMEQLFQTIEKPKKKSGTFANIEIENEINHNNELLETPIEILGMETGNFLVESEDSRKDPKKESENYLKSIKAGDDIPDLRQPGSVGIAGVRFMITDLCPYSCSYCNVYQTKLVKKGLISEEDYKKRDVASNEGNLVRDYNASKKYYLSPDDYKFLAAVLCYYYGTEDVSLTGGDPFERKEVKEIIDGLSELGIKTTALTKGAPLFEKDGSDRIRKKSGSLDRIIFSLDTLDPEKHAKLNLPLKDLSNAITYGPKTLETIKKASELGYEVDINTVVGHFDLMDLEGTNKSFQEIKDIIKFSLSAGVRKIKFIELESKDTIKKPYIEKYFELMMKMGYFSDLPVEKWFKPESINESLIRFNFAILKKENRKPLHLFMYRCGCPATALNTKENKLCEFSEGGSLYIDSTGNIIACNKLPDNSRGMFSLREHIIKREIGGVVGQINRAYEYVKEQYCPVK